MRCQVAAAAHLEEPAFHVARLPRDRSADCIRIALPAHQAHTQPVVPFRRVIAQKYRRGIVHTHENVDRAIVVEVSERQAAGGYGAREKRSTSSADVLKIAVA